MPSSTRHTANSPAPLLRRASDYRPRPVKWLWPGRIPLGSITLLAGDPGTGKSLFALDLAARVSTGAPWPDELPPALALSATTDSPHPPQSTACDSAINPQSEIPNPQSSPPGSVLLLSAIDQFHDTILPRLAAAGADSSRVFVLDHLNNLRAEMKELRATIDDLPDLKLLILDPINFYVGPGDAHFQTVVRAVLQPLAELACERGFAILAITHFRKNDGATLQRAAGSMGFVATARAIWTLTTDPDEERRRYLVPLKNNLTAKSTPLAFDITDREMTKDECPMTKQEATASTFFSRHSEIRHSLSAPHLTWQPTAACGLTPPRVKRSTLRDEAQRFLEQALADGPRPANELLAEADARGITHRTLQRVFHELDGHTKKEGLRAGWWWSLGEYPIAPIPDRPCDNPFAQPAYATDVAARVGWDCITGAVKARLADSDNQSPSSPPATPQMAPSHKPRKKPRSTTTLPLSPSHGFTVFRSPVSPKTKPRKQELPPSPLPFPHSLRNRPRTQDDPHTPKQT